MKKRKLLAEYLCINTDKIADTDDENDLLDVEGIGWWVLTNEEFGNLTADEANNYEWVEFKNYWISPE